MLSVENIANKGRGIIATESIAANSVIETAPAAAFPAEDRPTIDRTQVAKYYFVLPDDYQQSKRVEGYFVFGLASLCNHDDSPNAEIEWVKDEKGVWSRLRALQDINPGDEVTLYYTNLDEYSF